MLPPAFTSATADAATIAAARRSLDELHDWLIKLPEADLLAKAREVGLTQNEILEAGPQVPFIDPFTASSLPFLDPFTASSLPFLDPSLPFHCPFTAQHSSVVHDRAVVHSNPCRRDGEVG